MPIDSKIDPTQSSGVCHCAPTTARDISRTQTMPRRSPMVARPLSEHRAERQPHGQRGRAHRGDVPGRKGELCVVRPLDEGLDDVLAGQQGDRGERRKDDDTGDGLPNESEADRDGHDGADRRESQVLDEIGPGGDGRRRPEPAESAVLERVRAAAVRDGQGQDSRCEQGHQRGDRQPGALHQSKLRDPMQSPRSDAAGHDPQRPPSRSETKWARGERWGRLDVTRGVHEKRVPAVSGLRCCVPSSRRGLQQICNHVI